MSTAPAANTSSTPTLGTTTRTFLRPLPLHYAPDDASSSTAPLVLHTTWHPTTTTSSTSVAIELRLVNCATGSTHQGHMTHDILVATAASLEIDIATFIAATRHMLTGEPPATATDELQNQQEYDALESAASGHLFELTPMLPEWMATAAVGEPDTLQLTWRQRASDRLTVIYGTARLQLQAPPHAARLGDLLLEAVGQLAERSAQMRRRRIESDVMVFNHRLLRGNFEECVHSKLELEQGMLRRFLGVLNEKKSRIRQLERDIGGLDDKDGADTDMAVDATVEDDRSDASDAAESVFSDTLSGPLTAAAAKVVMAASRAAESPTTGAGSPDSSQPMESPDSMPLLATLLPKRLRSNGPAAMEQPAPASPAFDAAAKIADDERQQRCVRGPPDVGGIVRVVDAPSSDDAYGHDTQAMIDDMD